MAGMLYDTPLKICVDSKKIILIDNKKEQIVSSSEIITGRDICVFASSVYDYLSRVEKDQNVISALERLIFGINERIKKGRSLPPGFASAYNIIHEIIPEVLTFDLEIAPSFLVDDLDIAVSKLENVKDKLRVGEDVFITGIHALSDIAVRRGMSDIFTYRGTFYCTSFPQTYQFKKNLKIAAELL